MPQGLYCAAAQLDRFLPLPSSHTLVQQAIARRLAIDTGSGSSTLESAIRAVASVFDSEPLHYGHGTDNALDEAAWLVLHAAGLSPAETPDYQRVLSAEDLGKVQTLTVRRIQDRVPMAYLTGSAWFAGLELHSDERALIPRSPLAEFIQHDCLGLLHDVPRPRILDLCTGGGCIAIACAVRLPSAELVASDLSVDALALAGSNVARYGLEERVSLVQGSLFEPVNGRFDLILSNPPYVDRCDLSEMPEEFHHEPRLGLAAGEDGLDLVRQILQEAPDFLEPSGQLVVEVGNSALALQAAYPDLDLQWLEFEQGGAGVFMVSRQALLAARSA